MPIYSYQCQKPTCANIQEGIQKYADRETSPIEFCDKCGSTEPMLWVGRIETGHFTFKDGGHKGEYTKTGPRNSHPKRK